MLHLHTTTIMGAKYALYENPNPKGDEGEKQPLHARIVPKGTIHTQEIAEEKSFSQPPQYMRLNGCTRSTAVRDLKELITLLIL